MLSNNNKAFQKLRATNIYLIGIGLSTLSILIVAGFAVWGLNSQAQLVEKLYRHPFTVSTNVLEANAGLVAMHRYMKDVVIARDQQALDIAVQLVADNEEKVLSHLEVAKTEFLGDKKRFQRVIDSVIKWREIRNEVILLSKQKQYDSAASITLNKGAKYVELLNQEMAGLVAFARSKASEFRQSSRTQEAQFQAIQIAVYSIVIVAVISIFTYMFRNIRASEKGLRESEYRFRSIYENVPLSIWDEDFSHVYSKLESLRKQGITDIRHHFQRHPHLPTELFQSIIVRNVNEASLQIFNAPDKASLMTSLFETLGQGAVNVFCDALCAMWDKKPLFEAQANFIALDGKNIVGQMAIPLPVTARESHFVTVVIADVTEKVEAETQLKLFASVFTEASEGICIVSPDAQIVEVNDAFTDITGYHRDEVVGRNPSMLKSSRHNSKFYKDMWLKLLSTGIWQGEIWNRKKDGTVYPQMLTMSAVEDEFGDTKNYARIQIISAPLMVKR